MSDTHSFDSASIISFSERAGAKLAGMLSQGFTLVRRWTLRRALRRDLARLLATGPHMLRDIGIEEAEARREVALPFWRRGQLHPGSRTNCR